MNIAKGLKDVVVIVAISIALIATAEISLRILFPFKNQQISIFNPVAYQFNDKYLISLRPNITKRYIREEGNGGYSTLWRTNRHAFRGPELRSDPTHRIIVYGDSNVQARFSGHVRTYPGQLARYLEQYGLSDVEVINAGIAGSGPDQVLLRMTEQLDELKPDLVVFHIFADNDLGDLLRNRLFEIDSSGDLSRTGITPTSDLQMGESGRRRRRTLLKQFLVVQATEKVVKTAFHYAKSFVSSGTAHESPQAIDGQPITRKQKRVNRMAQLQGRFESEWSIYAESRPPEYSHFQDHYDLDVALYPEHDSTKTKIRLLSEVLRETKALTHMKGVELLVLIQPSVIDLTEDNAILSYEYLQQHYPDYDRRRLSDVVESACRLHDIHTINLFDLYLDNDPSDLYFRAGDDHWNDRGQQLAARATAEYLFDHRLIHY